MGTNLKSLGLVILVLLSTVQAESKHPVRFADLTKFKRVSDPQISPDGRWVAFAVGEQDIEGNWSRSHLWLVPFLGGEARQLTRGQNSNQRPRWSPDSRSLAFVSDRSGESQVWRIPVEGGEAWQVTRSITGASGVLWSLRGNRLLFTSRVFPECSDRDCNQKKFDQSKTQKIKARLVDRLLFRHWDHWREGRYTHLLATSADGGSARDLTPGAFDSPTWSLGGMDGYDISPDDKEICFTSNREEMSAASTNNDLYVVAVAGGELRKITDNPGSDTSPRYSSDGRWIAYLSQQRAGFESDRQRLMLYERDTRGIHEIKTGMDISISSFVWDFDSRTIYFTAQERVSFPLYKVMLDGGRPLKIVSGGVNGSVRVSADGHTLVFTRQSLTHPAEIHRRPVAGKKVRALTDFNRMLLEELELNSGESFEATSADGTPLHGFLLKPPAFDSRKKYSSLLLIHGGPQGAWTDSFHYRWNAQMFASRSYVVMMANPRGSTGYGLKFMEAISGDWGGKCYEDLMAVADAVAKLPYVDGDRMGAVGGSFGGYMVNWIATHTDRFKTLVSHAGVYDLRSMYGSTEELWFLEWEFGGVPWEKPDLYEKWSPSNFVQQVRTPLLLIHGEKDYRVPMNQVLQFFTALQRRGIPSRLLYYPDEGHWVLKPQNSQLWYKTVLDWFGQYLHP